MASVRIYCDCKVRELGTAKIDLYTVFPTSFLFKLLEGKAECKHCGALVKYVGDRGCMSERKANKLDAKLLKEQENDR